MRKLRVLDLFSGIGGFSLGLERTGGFETIAFCEIDPFCRKVLAKHWPNVPCFEDVTKLKGTDIDGPVDLICGGFPCQDISRANSVWSSRPGLQGARSGLWNHFARIIREVRPSYVIVENVPDLLSRGFGSLLIDLAKSGYDAEWDCLPASFVGLPHTRQRLWLVSYPSSVGLDGKHRKGKPSRNLGRIFDDVSRQALQWFTRQNRVSEPDVPRVVNGTPNRMDRINRTKALGNAVVPQIPELIGHAILQSIREPHQHSEAAQ